MDRSREYFEFIADLGMTKHYGSMAATRELVELCSIDENSVVLDVGCGVGATPCYLAKTIGCRVVGVDLIEKMIHQSRHRAQTEGIRDLVTFAVADARDLPFDNDLFDAVITESVNVFFDDKVRPMREYVRVTRSGGYVGMTEMAWLRPPPSDIEDAFDEMVHAKARDAEGWKALMESTGLVDVAGNVYPIDISSETKGRSERYGCWGLVRIMVKMLAMFVGDRRARRFIKEGTGAASKDLLNVMGYGVFAGRKASRRLN